MKAKKYWILVVLIGLGFCLWSVIWYMDRFSTTDEFLRGPRKLHNFIQKGMRALRHKIRGESQVVNWLWECPPLEGSWFVYPADTKYSSHTEWIEAGRNINEVEKKLISLYRRNVYPMLTHEIIYALGHLGTEKSLPLLIEIVKNKEHDPTTRIEAAVALGEIGKPAAVQPLCKIVSSPDAMGEIERKKTSLNGGGDETGWSKPVAGLQCRLECDKQIYTLGEVPTATMYLRNASEKQITLFGRVPSPVNLWSWSLHEGTFRLSQPEVKREQFQALRPGETCRLHSVKLKPGGHVRWYDEGRNSRVVPFGRPDIYRLEAWYRNDEENYTQDGSHLQVEDGGAFGIKNVWVGKVKAAATFAVLPKKLGAPVDGLQCKIWTDKQEYRTGDRIVIFFSVKNLGDQTRRLFLEWLAPSVCAFVVQGPDGKLIPFTGGKDNVRPLAESNFKTLEPGGALDGEVAWFNTPEPGRKEPPAYRIIKPGTYRVTMFLEARFDRYYSRRRGETRVPDAWTGTVPSNTIGITVQAKREKELFFWLWFSVVSSPVLFGLAVVAIIACILATRKTNKTHRVAWRVRVILPTILVLLAVSVWKIHRFTSHIVDPEAYEAIEVGMTQERVADLLGQPPDRNLPVWRYEKPGVFEFVEIYFDEDGKVKEKTLDR